MKMTFAAFEEASGMCSVEQVLGPETAGGIESVGLGSESTRGLKASRGLVVHLLQLLLVRVLLLDRRVQ